MDLFKRTRAYTGIATIVGITAGVKIYVSGASTGESIALAFGSMAVGVGIDILRAISRKEQNIINKTLTDKDFKKAIAWAKANGLDRY